MDVDVPLQQLSFEQHPEMKKIIRKELLDKSLKMFEELSEDKNRFEMFYDQYGTNLKLGVIQDPQKRDRILNSVRFHTSASGEEYCSLVQYVSRMKENQQYIYCIRGGSI